MAGNRFAFGVLAGWLVVRTGGLEAGIAAHVANNVSSFALAALTSSMAQIKAVTAVTWVLAAWDLFLDPQMVGQGYWSWEDAGWALPGIPGIPMQNFLGWLLAAIVLMALLDRLPRKTVSDAVPNVMLMWVYASSVFANLVFFGRPGVALWGGICMGVVVVPWLWRMWSQPQW